MPLSRYELKRLALTPRTAYRRRRHRDLEPLARQLLETALYGQSMYDFMDAVAAKPDLLTDVPIGDDGVALDLGAYIGEWSKAVATRFGCSVYAFEANPSTAEKAAKRLAALPRVTVFPYGVGTTDEIVELSRDGPGSSIYGGNGEFGHVEVQVRDIVTVLHELGLDEIDVLKVNIEGAEYDVLDRLIAADWLPRIGTLSVQFHEWHPKAHPRRKRIRSALRATHEEAWDYPWVWELWHRRLDSVAE